MVFRWVLKYNFVHLIIIIVTFLFVKLCSHGDRVVWNGSQCWLGDNSVWSCDLSQLELPTYWPTQYGNRAVPRLYEKGSRIIRGVASNNKDESCT